MALCCPVAVHTTFSSLDCASHLQGHQDDYSEPHTLFLACCRALWSAFCRQVQPPLWDQKLAWWEGEGDKWTLSNGPERKEVSQTPSHVFPNQQLPALGPDQLWWPLARGCTGWAGWMEGLWCLSLGAADSPTSPSPGQSWVTSPEGLLMSSTCKWMPQKGNGKGLGRGRGT